MSTKKGKNVPTVNTLSVVNSETNERWLVTFEDNELVVVPPEGKEVWTDTAVSVKARSSIELKGTPTNESTRIVASPRSAASSASSSSDKPEFYDAMMEMFRKGISNSAIHEELGIPKRTLAAYRANFTRSNR